MRVLTIGNRFPPETLGGYEALWYDTATWLRDRGHEVNVLACDLPARGDPPWVRRELRWYWRDHSFPRLGARARLELERHNQAVLRSAIAELEPDVVCWWSMGGMSMSLLAQVGELGLPAAGVLADQWLSYGPTVDAWTRLWRWVPIRRFTGIPTTFEPERVSCWIVISEMLRRRAATVRKARLKNLRVAHAGVDPARFSRHPRHEWKGEVLYAGRLDPRKGIDTVVRALAQLDTISLTIDGGGNERYAAELQALAREQGVAERVSFTRTPRATLAGQYAAADALLYPVRWAEPWGLAPLEAMAVGTPVVTTGLGGSGEYLRDGDNALLVLPDRPDELASAIRLLAEDASLRSRLRAGGLRTAADFPAQAFFETVESVLTELFPDGRSSTPK